MIQFYLKKLKHRGLETFVSLLKQPSTLILMLNLGLISVSLYLSLYLKLGDDLAHVSLNAVVLNIFLYVLFGISAMVAQRFPFLKEVNSGLVLASYLTLLYIPVLLLLPEELSLPSSTPYISWFVLVILLQIPQWIRFKPEVETQKDQIFAPQTLEDLLQRPALAVDKKSVATLLKDKRILITGAGGSLGSELIRQIGAANPSRLGLVENNEHLLYIAALEAKELAPKLSRETFLGDVSSRERIRQIISTFKPDIVIHDGTLKQIPVGEENPSQTVLTNVTGTQNVADACRDFKVKAMVCLSSHEAGQPSNMIGATKRLAEGYCQALDVLERKKPNGTRYITVRLGNLLEASGSVVPLFKRQIEKGGPVTVTHPEVMRYFIRTQEAVGLVLQSLVLGVTSDKKENSLFALERGEPLKIIDLANHLIRMANANIKVEFIGLRAGDKLIEDTSADDFHPTQNPHISAVSSRTMDHGFLTRALHELALVAKNQDQASIFRLLQALVPEYKKRDLEEETSVAVGNL